MTSAAPTAPDADPDQDVRPAEPVDRRCRPSGCWPPSRRHRADLLVGAALPAAGRLAHPRALARPAEPDAGAQPGRPDPLRVVPRRRRAGPARRLLPAHRPAQRAGRGQPDGQHHGHRARRAPRPGHPAVRRAGHLRPAGRRRTWPAPRSPGTCCSPGRWAPAGSPPALGAGALRLRPGHGLADQQPPAHDRAVAGPGDRLAGGPAAPAPPTRPGAAGRAGPPRGWSARRSGWPRRSPCRSSSARRCSSSPRSRCW